MHPKEIVLPPALDVLSQDPAHRNALKEVLQVAEAMRPLASGDDDTGRQPSANELEEIVLPAALDVLSQDPAHRNALKEVLQVAEAMAQNRERAIELIRSEPSAPLMA